MPFNPSNTSMASWQQPASTFYGADSSGFMEGWVGDAGSFWNYNTSIHLHGRSIAFTQASPGVKQFGSRINAGGMSVQGDHLYAVVCQFRSDVVGEPPVMSLRVEMGLGNWSSHSSTTHDMGIPAKGEWVTAVQFFHVPPSGVDTVRLSFARFFDHVNTNTAGTVYMGEVRIVDYGTQNAMGDIWLPKAPATKTAFNSGNNEIVIDENGAWYLDGNPFIIKASYPDWQGDFNASMDRHYAEGYNTAYQLAPFQYTIANENQKLVIDITDYIRNNSVANVASQFNTMLTQLGSDSDRWIGCYLDVENEVFWRLPLIKQMINIINSTTDAAGTHRRPIIVHCQTIGGHEMLDPYVAAHEFKANPAWADKGICYPGTVYDVIQEASGYAANIHPQLTKPYTTSSFNTPHMGDYFAEDIVNSFIMGATGYSVWRDAPDLTYCGVGRGYADHDWWQGISDVHTQLDALAPFVAANKNNEYNATVTGDYEDGWTGVRHTFRVVGDEVWPAFANLDGSAKTINVSLPEDFVSISEVLSQRASFSSSANNSFTVTMQPYSALVLRMDYNESTGSVTLPSDVADITAANYTTSATVTPAGTTVNFSITGGATLDVNGDEVTITPATRPAGYTLTASITVDGVTYTDTQQVGFAALALTAKDVNVTVGGSNPSIATIDIQALFEGGTPPVEGLTIVVKDSNGNVVASPSVSFDVSGNVVVDEVDAPPGNYTADVYICDDREGPVDPDPSTDLARVVIPPYNVAARSTDLPINLTGSQARYEPASVVTLVNEPPVSQAAVVSNLTELSSAIDAGYARIRIDGTEMDHQTLTLNDVDKRSATGEVIIIEPHTDVSIAPSFNFNGTSSGFFVRGFGWQSGMGPDASSRFNNWRFIVNDYAEDVFVSDIRWRDKVKYTPIAFNPGPRSGGRMSRIGAQNVFSVYHAPAGYDSVKVAIGWNNLGSGQLGEIVDSHFANIMGLNWGDLFQNIVSDAHQAGSYIDNTTVRGVLGVSTFNVGRSGGNNSPENAVDIKRGGRTSNPLWVLGAVGFGYGPSGSDQGINVVIHKQSDKARCSNSAAFACNEGFLANSEQIGQAGVTFENNWHFGGIDLPAWQNLYGSTIIDDGYEIAHNNYSPNSNASATFSGNRAANVERIGVGTQENNRRTVSFYFPDEFATADNKLASPLTVEVPADMTTLDY